VLFAGVLLLMATSRWGSYLHIPGVTFFYLGDAVVLLALVQAFVLWRQGLLTLHRLRRAPRTEWLVAAFLGWALLRVVTRTALPLVAVRDLAPYAYAIVTPLTFLLPWRSRARTRVWIYAALGFHAAWYIAAVRGLVDPTKTWRVGNGVGFFGTRPDFDSAVFGIAIAFAVHQIAFGPRPRTRVAKATIAAFIGINGYAVSSQHSRSGLLAGLVAIGAVVAGWLLRTRVQSADRGLAKRGAVATVAVAAAALALLLTVPGQRLIDGIDGKDGVASGTSHARVLVFDGVSQWLLQSPVLTTFGVGYGPNFLARSGTSQYLEGVEFQNVRSPHNYLLGTWARLGLIGAALAAAIFVAAGRLALRRLRTATDPADLLAALIVLTIPLTAMLGVVLESPFGAIPYFWAVGQLCATAKTSSRVPTDAVELRASTGAER
jgi:O-antigen ligase